MAFFFLAGIISAVFVVSIGQAWRPIEGEPGSYPIWAGFLSVAQLLLLGATLLTSLFLKEFSSVLLVLMLPSLCALLAESFLYALKALRGLVLRSDTAYLHWPAALLLLAAPMLAVGGRLIDPNILPLVLSGGALLALAWLDWDRLGKWRAASYLLLLALLLMAVWREDTRSQFLFLPSPLASLANFTLSAAIGMGFIVPFRILGGWLSDEKFPNFRRLFWLGLLLTPLFLLLSWLGATASAWDVATDGLSGVLLQQIAAVLGVGAASLLAWRLPAKRISAPYAAAFVLPLVMLAATSLGEYGLTGQWGQVPHIRTELRAAMIDQAIRRYHQAQGSYPMTLSELTPGYLLYLPTPFIIPRQDWCYQGGEDYYRLGYVNRDYFSTPTSVEVYASAGQPPDESWNCRVTER